MSSTSEVKEPSSILIEFVREEESAEVETVSIRQLFKKDKAGLEKKSDVAISKAMETIKDVSDRISWTIENLQNQPNTVEVGFGIKFDAMVDVLIAKVGAEASMNVTLKWENEKVK